MNAIEEADIQQNVKQNPLNRKYSRLVDRDSAYEILTEERQEAEEQAEQERKQAEKEAERREKEAARRKSTSSSRKTTSSRKKTTALDKAISSAANTVGREVGKTLIRGILGSLKW